MNQICQKFDKNLTNQIDKKLTNQICQKSDKDSANQIGQNFDNQSEQTKFDKDLHTKLTKI